MSLAASAATLHVWQDSPGPAAPYADWATAAHAIQDAVDAASMQDTVLVTNGVYATGGRVMGGLMTRVAIPEGVTVQSVNGRGLTIIEGYQMPGTVNGSDAVRCAWLSAGAVLRGFTLTKGATSMKRDWDFDVRGGGAYCGDTGSVVADCTLVGNSAWDEGGGVYGGTLDRCVLSSNQAGENGGGAYESTLNNCVLTGNSSSHRGGATEGCVLNHCTLTGNTAHNYGGGAFGGTLHNCILWDNTARFSPNYYGGRLDYCCTTPMPLNGVGNITSDPQLASVSHLSAASPCIGAGSPAYATGTDIDGEAWSEPPSMGCDEYHPGAVTGPLNVEPQVAFTNVATGYLVDFHALIEGRTTASAWNFGDGVVVSNRPYARHAWSGPGTYDVELRAWNESHPEGVGASMMVQVVERPVHYVAAESPSPAPPFASWPTAARTIQEAVDAAIVPGALVLVSNGVYGAGGRAIVGTMTNRVAIEQPITVQSVNGPEFTIIQGHQVPGTTNGDGAVRCVYLARDAVLSGFTLSQGATRSDGDGFKERCGGGAWCGSASAVLTNCILTRNSAAGYSGGVYGGTLDQCTLMTNLAGSGGGAGESTLTRCILSGNGARYSGGGAFSCAMDDCVIIGNSAGTLGGGADECALDHCTITGNLASNGGGSAEGKLRNCIVWDNTAPLNANSVEDYLDYCCTTPMPTGGVGNITNAPLFVDYAGGNLRLQSNSPCINAGNNAYAASPTDLDGNPRIVSGTVDLGAYEYQGPGSLISYAWLQQFGLPTDGSLDFVDSDNDRLNNWQEWIADTDPTNVQSLFRIEAIAPGPPVTVQFLSSSDRLYTLHYSPDLAGTNATGATWASIAGQTDRPGTGGAFSLTDTNVTAPRFYRVEVRQP